MRVALLCASLLLVAACASRTDQLACSTNAISDLREVLDNPVSTEGREFCGYAYVYAGQSYYAFWPVPIHGDEPDVADVTIMPGQSADVDSLAGVSGSERLFVRGHLRPLRACFSGDVCTPWPHPVFIDGLEISR